MATPAVQVIYQGDLLPLLVFTAEDENGNAISLVGSTCQVLFGPVNGQPGFTGAGTCTVATNVATYQLAASDTLNSAYNGGEGQYLVQLVATFAEGSQTFKASLVTIKPRVAA